MGARALLGSIPAVFSIPDRAGLFSPPQSRPLSGRVLGVRGVLGLGCPAKDQSGMTPKLIMYLAVGRDS